MLDAADGIRGDRSRRVIEQENGEVAALAGPRGDSGELSEVQSAQDLAGILVPMSGQVDADPQRMVGNGVQRE
ncbi:hypothetical protein [Streptomyces alanosinicus]|uniref:hypothetical protein n=1 Tax=Streptomyces alanosinicus TaxID=68171 RepID=UPI0016755E7A